jgi:hypothetical protein
LYAETTTGGVAFTIDITGEVGAKVEASTGFGGVNVEQQGFSADRAPLQSTNFPAASNFIVNLRTTTGGIEINSNYDPGVRS